MRSEPARLGGISLDFVGISPRRDENFPYEQPLTSSLEVLTKLGYQQAIA